MRTHDSDLSAQYYYEMKKYLNTWVLLFQSPKSIPKSLYFVYFSYFTHLTNIY